MELIKGYDSWKTKEPERKEVAVCAECGYEIYEGDDGYIVSGEAFHKHCFEDEFKVVF